MAAPNPKPAIGFVGLGAMGFGMATHLVKQGYPVKGFDVFPKTMEKWVAAGGIPAKSLADSADGVDYYVVMVASAPQAQGALFGREDGIVKALPKGATLLLCSTVPASYAQSVQSQLDAISRSDIFFIDSPVSGGAGRAAAGTLSIMAGATPAALENGQWLLEELSEKLYIAPSGLGGGSNLKMAHQVLAGIHILAVSEALGLAARLGLNAEEVVKAVNESDAWSWMFENRAPRTLKEDYYPGASALTIILKDVGIITSTGRSLDFPLPLSETAEQVYVTGLSHGYGPNDDAGVVRLYFPDPIAQVTSPYTPTSPQTVTSAPAPAASASTSDSTSTSTSTSMSGIDIVLTFLRIIHTLSLLESLTFTSHLSLALPQFYSLCSSAAGSSSIFKSHFHVYAKALDPAYELPESFSSSSSSSSFPSSSGATAAAVPSLAQLSRDIKTVLHSARRVECPMYLGTAALNLLGIAERRQRQRRGGSGTGEGEGDSVSGIRELLGLWGF